jgi:hypothetical protein
MSKLASLIGANEVKFTLPFMDKTKGELVKSLAGVDLQAFAASTVSCVHYPIRHKKYKQCGLCPACIFRRVALRASGIPEPENAYKHGFWGPAERINHLPEKSLAYLKAFLMQVAQLRDIENTDRLPSTFERHVVPHIVPKGQSQKGVIQLLARYRDEWMNIASEGKARGLDWARLLAAHRPETQGVCHVSD